MSFIHRTPDNRGSAQGAIMNTATRVTYARVQGAGWSVFVVTGQGANRVFKRAPGFENCDTYTMQQAQIAADNYRRDIAQGMRVQP